ncbi:hypothetical protein CHS0354_041333 [Potamilus streckersoni]|uniref:NACHT and WD repeat domain-containing protein 1 n=1 Tax=Potamilus streckersoni TaxID=2493646 RepID=A0AAE0SE01_9BIVA|nr:hypothetical protein CHS0354_041333 [Potamilus streckersoni]
MGSGSSKKSVAQAPTSSIKGNEKKSSDVGQSKTVSGPVSPQPALHHSTTPVLQTRTVELQTPVTRGMLQRQKSKEMLLRSSTMSVEERLNEIKAKLKKIDDINAKLMQNQTVSAPYLALHGNVNIECPSSAKIVRIFTSSTFTDTTNERNYLMEHAYPQLKSFCQQLGYEFQVVDMRWGIRDEATDDQMGMELCLKELRLCQKLSTGPNFVTLLSHKYGYTAFPRTIEAEEFEKLASNMESQEALILCKKWYHRDDNAVPPVYILDAISIHLPDFLSKDEERRKVAKNTWWKESELMQRALEETSMKIFEDATARKYVMSITEAEITMGLLSTENKDKHCIWLKRTITDIEKEPSSVLLSRYTECMGQEEKLKKVKNLLQTLKEEKMEKSLPSDRILSYKIHWTKNGITIEEKEHREYLQKMNNDFVSKMTAMIKTAVEERSQKEDPLMDEVYRHIRFCQTKIYSFYGQEESIKIIEQYIDSTATLPLVIYGQSGCGKTSIMAMGAKVAYDHLKGKALVVLRFLGTTPETTSVKALLKSVTMQIKKIYAVTIPVPEVFSELVEDFHTTLRYARASKPLILFFDSLDQLDTGNNARQLAWLPKKLPNYVKIIISTLPDENYECLPVLRNRISDTTKFHEVPTLPDKDVSGIIDKLLSVNKRTLTKEQKGVIQKAFLKCPLALFLKLSFDEALRWKSFTKKEELVLQSSVRESINALFQRLEVLHGKLFVSRSLGYLTIARMGITESELEDVLSCDDEVLNDVYMYWTPPVRRLPPLLLVRLKTDLEQYLVDRGADGARVLFWYHRQFIEAAQERYASDQNINSELHAALADFFAGSWANGRKKPFKDKNGEKSEDRHVSQQPLKFENFFNLRKLNNLPYHRIKAGHSDLLKKECLANFDFLVSKLQATGFWNVNDDFLLAKKLLPKDETIEIIHETLQISQKALYYDPCQLPSQMLCRMETNPKSEEFLRQCKACPFPYLIPDKNILLRPGGQLMYSLAVHKGEVHTVDVTVDGQIAVTAGEDENVCLWDTAHGKYILKFECKGVASARFCCGDKYLVCEEKKFFTIREVQTGLTKTSIRFQELSPWTLVGTQKGQLVSFAGNSVSIYDLIDGSTISTLKSQEKFENPSQVTGSVNYAACSCGDSYSHSFALLDVKNKTFLYTHRAFPVRYDDDGDEDYIDIDCIVITPNEKYLIFSNLFDNDIHIMDIKLRKEIKVIEGNKENFLQDFKVTLDGKFLFCFDSSVLKIFDLETYKQTECLEHPVNITAVCSPDLKTVVTIAEDGNLRVWNRNRVEHETQAKTKALADKLTSFLPMPNPRYILGSATRDKENTKFFIFIYDIIKKEIVREANTEMNALLTLLGGNHAIMTVRDQDGFSNAYVIKLESMTPVTKLQGKIVRASDLLVFNNDKEAITVTKGRKHLKIFDIQSGKVSTIIKAGQTERIDKLEMNAQGFILVARCETLMLVFNLKKRQFLYKIDVKKLGSGYTGITSLITPDDKCILFDINKVPEGAPKKKSTEVSYIVSWDVEKNEKLADLLDIEYYRKYETTDNVQGLATSMDTARLLDNDTAIISDDDFIMRHYDIKTGKLLKRFEGMHTTGLEMHATPQIKRFVTYGCWSEEDAFRLWDKSLMSCLASFKLDQSVTKLQLTKDGRYIVAYSKHAFGIVTWHLINGDDQGMPNYPEEFPNKNPVDLDLSVLDAVEYDTNDPDTDPEEEDEDDEIEDDADSKDEKII